MNGWLLAAYTLFFLGICGYTLLMSQKQKDLDRRIEELRHRLDEERSPKPR